MSEEASEAGSRWLSREISGGPERITARAAFVRALVGGSHSGSFIRALSFDEGASRMARGADGAGLSGTAARQRMTQVFAAQPYTRSITPRYGSTARSGSRLFEKEEIVSSGPEARWASSNAHRPGAVPAVPNCTATARERDTGYVWCGAGRASAWLSKTECHSARGRSVAAKAPRSGIERFDECMEYMLVAEVGEKHLVVTLFVR